MAYYIKLLYLTQIITSTIYKHFISFNYSQYDTLTDCFFRRILIQYYMYSLFSSHLVMVCLTSTMWFPHDYTYPSLHCMWM